MSGHEAEKAIDRDWSTWSNVQPDTNGSQAWIKLRLAAVSCISQVLVRIHNTHAPPDIVWTCSEQRCTCDGYFDWCLYHNMLVNTESQDGYNFDNDSQQQCTSGNLVMIEAIRISGFSAREIILIGGKA